MALIGIDENLKDNLKTCLVIGGGSGFLGSNLVHALLKWNCKVRVLNDVYINDYDPSATFIHGDIRNFDEVLKACQGVDTVFHVASIIQVGGLMRQSRREYIYEVNVVGTRNILQACAKSDVSRLVYTSSNNVVFDREIENGDETLPYAEKFYDVYTLTKALAEKAVLSANGYNGVLTCALRPGGIYGYGDKIILPRFLEASKKGICFCIGDGSALGDIIHIDNAVQAHLLAALNLKKDTSVAGQAYFISDGEPCNYFDFMRPLIKILEIKWPRTQIPMWLAYSLAYAAEVIHYVTNSDHPFLSRMEVRKMCISNYFSIKKASDHFGYHPQFTHEQRVMSCLPYCLQILNTTEIVNSPNIGWWFSVLSGLSLTGLLAYSTQVFDLWSFYVTSVLSQSFFQIVFIAAILIHLAEAFYAFKIAKQAGLKTAHRWASQTLLLGYPSLCLLLQRVKGNTKE